MYELEVANGVAYQTPSGFLEEYVPGQDIKYPRDVLRDKSGTCVDLAIIYASACEAVGLKTSLVIVPGHCFPVIHLPDGGLLPVECTGISGAVVGANEQQKLSFFYPEEWNIQEEEGAIQLVHPEAFAQVTILRIWEDSDPKVMLNNVEEYLAQEYDGFAVTSRTQVMVSGMDAWRVDAQSTSTEGIDVIHNLLLLYESGLARALAVCAMLGDQHVALSPIVEQILDSIILLED